MNILSPDPGLLFWMTLSFGVVFFLLAKFAFPIITGTINKRQEFIEQSLVAAEEANEKLAGIQTEGERILADAKSQQQDIIAGAMAEKQQIVTAAKEQASDEARKIAEESAKSIEIAKQNALKDVRGEVAGLAIEIAEKILKEKMSDDAAQQATIAKMLENL